MTVREQIERLWANLLKLGMKRLITLGVIGVSVFAMTGLAGYFLSRPAQEILYSGLDRQDVSRIASALKEADIPFDVNADGNAVLVRFGETARARMLLAEKGLPNSPNAGNELYDKLGSLGLTSFMQEVTRVRALEGELSRTIQLMHGVKAARVHIVMPEEGSFRRVRQPPSASVVVRMDSNDESGAAKAIRHLVASAVPGMTVEEVTVLNTEGVLLASGADTVDGAPSGMMVLEKAVSREIIDNIRKTLTPYLGLRNFQVSVATHLNTDKKQTNETIYNPDSKVERSTRVTKHNQNSQNSTVQSPTTVERNLPQETTRSDDGKQSTEESQKREELTNYEISSKVINTVSGGYGIETLSVAVLINRASLISSLGEKPTPEALTKQMEEIEQLVASASGAHKERGDSIKISAVDFIDPNHELEPQPPISFAELALRQSSNLVNAVTILIVTILLIWFGLRPATKAVLANTRSNPVSAITFNNEDLQDLDEEEDIPASLPSWSPPSETNLIEDLTGTQRRTPQKRLEQIIEYDEQQAAAVLKQWIHQGEDV
ncbi:flagellar basal-body MS-ring/collar protein FliF [Beijerinckia mobilis]|uniref:flagellar basal-body MS-ring/collar protein FliF n=1 Tax=Beijerinckia mobilis TaxID=231434 RepID=UPI000552A3BC|nr:flagellar basal-body MS-ring/collar protein FliF [Beijerinckia mobilis]